MNEDSKMKVPIELMARVDADVRGEPVAVLLELKNRGLVRDDSCRWG